MLFYVSIPGVVLYPTNSNLRSFVFKNLYKTGSNNKHCLIKKNKFNTTIGFNNYYHFTSDKLNIKEVQKEVSCKLG